MDDHISDHALERYYLGMVRKGSAEEAKIEEHLLWCHECVLRAEGSDAYVDAIRAALIEGDYDLEI
jgi:hypothetical protein